MYTQLYSLSVHEDRFFPIKLGAVYLKSKNEKWVTKKILQRQQVKKS
jgi:hypothetical protein